MKSYSRRLAEQLRKDFGLPPIKGKQKPDVIKGLKGMMKEYNDGESAVDAIREMRDRDVDM